MSRKKLIRYLIVMDSEGKNFRLYEPDDLKLAEIFKVEFPHQRFEICALAYRKEDIDKLIELLQKVKEVIRE